MKYRLIVALCLFFSSIVLFFYFFENEKVEVKDLDLAKQYFMMADTSMNADTSLYYSEKAIPYLKESELWDEYIDILNGMAYWYNESNDLNKFENSIYKALEESMSLPLKDETKKIDVLINYASFLVRVKKDYKKAIKIYEDNLKNIDFENPIREAKVYNNIGDIFERQGDFSSALIYLNRSLEIYKNKGGSKAEIYKALSNIADCYNSIGDYETAKEYYLQAYEVLNTFSKKEIQSKYYVGVYTSLAKLYVSEKEYSKALSYLNKIKKENLNAVQISKLIEIEATVYKGQGEYEKAINNFNKALVDLPENGFVNKISVLKNLGELHYFLGNNKESLDCVNKSIWFLVKESPLGHEKDDLPSVDLKLYSEKDMLDLLSLKSKLLIKENTLDKLKEALDVFDYAFFVQKKYQQNILNDRAKIFQNQKASNLYEDAIALCWNLFEKTTEEIYAEKAFAYMESNKSSVLLEEIKRKEAEGFSKIDTKQLNNRYDLIAKQRYIEHLISNSKGESKGNLNIELINVQNEIIKVDNKIKKENSDFVSNAEEYELESIENVQEMLFRNNNSAICSFFLVDSFAYTIYLERDEIRFNKIPLSDLNNKITNLLDLRQYSTKTQQEEYNNLAKDIYTDLLGPFLISKEINHLIIIPDKILYYLPFEMLKMEDGEFVLEKYRTTYTYSATILNALLDNKKESNELLAIAPVFDQKEDKVTLASSTDELEGISSYFKTKSLLRKKASKKRFLNESGNYKFIHLSTHAYAKGENEPFIMFYNDTLFLKEIYGQRFNAEMIVLSACETGLGKEEKGEGLMSLSRGFTYAGIPSQVTSLWSINESSTKDIVISFYNYLSQGKNKSEALRLAKIDYLEMASIRQSSPYYWAGLIQLGNFEAVKK